VTAVAIRDLTKYFGRVTAVQALSFDASPGQITGFLGPNGAGKTTTLRVALGLVRPTAGEALIGGQPYAALAHPRRVVGAVLDASALHPARTGRDHLRVLAAAAGVPARRVDEVLAVVRLDDAAAGRRVGGYSMGMRQRLGLAGALLGDPAVLILDEPANGLDPAGIAWLRGMLRQFAGEGRTIVVSSHLLSEVAQTVDQVVILTEGRLRYAGPLAELAAESSLEAEFLRLTTGALDGAG
jgi:ABC-2 type transport system ATP-binding protein